jgi:hypothetical protein
VCRDVVAADCVTHLLLLLLLLLTSVHALALYARPLSVYTMRSSNRNN